MVSMVFIIDGFSFTMRTHGVNRAFRFDEGIWLHRKSHQIRFYLSEKDLVYIILAQRAMSNHLNHGWLGEINRIACHAGGMKIISSSTKHRVLNLFTGDFALKYASQLILLGGCTGWPKTPFDFFSIQLFKVSIKFHPLFTYIITSVLILFFFYT